MNKLIFFLCIFFPLVSNAQDAPMEIHCKHFFKGYPLGTPKSNDLIIRDIYALSNNDLTKFADWLAYRLSMHEVDGELDVERKWRADPWLDETETLEPNPDDYKNASSALQMDRGHQAPHANFKGSRFASQAAYLSNITPQKTDLNQGLWENLEEKERAIVREGKTIYVMTGPLYERAMPKLPQSDEAHSIPSGYWKIIIVPENSRNFDVAAFIFDQDTPRNSKLLTHLTTVNDIEARSGLNFFWELEDTQEEQIENQKNIQWVERFFR